MIIWRELAPHEVLRETDVYLPHEGTRARPIRFSPYKTPDGQPLRWLDEGELLTRDDWIWNMGSETLAPIFPPYGEGDMVWADAGTDKFPGGPLRPVTHAYPPGPRPEVEHLPWDGWPLGPPPGEELAP